MLLYTTDILGNLEKTFSDSYFKIIAASNTTIAKHGEVFVVKGLNTHVYLFDGLSFDFGDNNRINENFVIEMQSPIKTYNLGQLDFRHVLVSELGPAHDFPEFKAINISLSGKNMGHFFLCKSNKEKNILKMILKGVQFIESETNDIYWEMIKILFNAELTANEIPKIH
jgi:hypothetical protein